MAIAHRIFPLGLGSVIYLGILGSSACCGNANAKVDEAATVGFVKGIRK
jgi:hypothetical protein